MSVEGLIASLFLLLVTVILVGMPVLARGKASTASAAAQEKQREQLVAYYERVLAMLRDLDEDHSTGKMQAEDYQYERELWAQRGVQALKALEQFDEQGVIVDAEVSAVFEIDAATDEAIEDAIAQYLTTNRSEA